MSINPGTATLCEKDAGTLAIDPCSTCHAPSRLRTRRGGKALVAADKSAGSRASASKETQKSIAFIGTLLEAEIPIIARGRSGGCFAPC
jgi:hypothetical protein